MSDFLTIINSNELIRIAAGSLVYVSSSGNYSDIYTRDGERRTVTMQLGMIEELINKQLQESDREFIRIGKSLIVNLRFLHYLNPSKKQIVLSDNSTFKISLEASKEALKQLKDYIELKIK
ncbi:MAG: LytTR family DNA-binding domain-containing protein [Bacteroidales bacterium]|nr:LytTR family DNA-binding domain-containing protein [Bacteroidales bacterium]MDY6348446.1 LytTR family DNA-binding domain-containing protein [Bacteroidales bacterium]